MPKDLESYKREDSDKGCEDGGTKSKITDRAKTLGATGGRERSPSSFAPLQHPRSKRSFAFGEKNWPP